MATWHLSVLACVIIRVCFRLCLWSLFNNRFRVCLDYYPCFNLGLNYYSGQWTSLSWRAHCVRLVIVGLHTEGWADFCRISAIVNQFEDGILKPFQLRMHHALVLIGVWGVSANAINFGHWDFQFCFGVYLKVFCLQLWFSGSYIAINIINSAVFC